MTTFSSAIEYLLSYFKVANEYGAWDFISTLVILQGFRLIFLKRKRIPKFNLHFQIIRDNSNYPLKVGIEFRNYTGCPCVISFPSVKLKSVRGDKNGRANSSTGDYEVKFINKTSGDLEEIDIYLKHGESASTWVPVDPTHQDSEIDAALRNGDFGQIEFSCTWVSDRPVYESVRMPIKII